jgi:hypothetical protein
MYAIEEPAGQALLWRSNFARVDTGELLCLDPAEGRGHPAGGAAGLDHRPLAEARLTSPEGAARRGARRRRPDGKMVMYALTSSSRALPAAVLPDGEVRT